LNRRLSRKKVTAVSLGPSISLETTILPFTYT